MSLESRSAVIKTLVVLPLVALLGCQGMAEGDDGPDESVDALLAGEVSLWSTGAVPANPADPDTSAVELGLKWKPLVNGKASGIRFYKSSGNGGTHVGHLWAADGTKLAELTFSGETRRGWQLGRFAAPVTVKAGQTYVVSYHAPRGRYAGDNGYFASAGRAIGPLYAFNSGESGGNGVYRYGSPGFPTQSWQGSNYYVDVIFIADTAEPTPTPTPTPTPNPNPTPTPDTTAPAAPSGLTATVASSSQINLRWTAATDNTGVTSYLVFRGTTQVATVSETTYADSGLSPSTSYTYQVKAKDAAGNVGPASNSAAATTQGSPSVDCVRAVWTNLEACGWAGPANTGVPSGTTLRVTQGRTLSVDGTIIDGEQIDGGLTIAAKNVIVRNSLITKFVATGTAANGSGVIKILPGASATLEHNTLDGREGVHSCIWDEGASMVARYNNCFNTNDAIFIWNADNFTIEHNYIHNLSEKPANGHVDGFQTEGAAHGVIRHNTFDIAQGQTSCLAIWNGNRNSDDILVEGNLMAGGGFSVYAEDYSPSEASPAGGNSVTNIRFVDNRFSTVHYGCVGSFGVWFPRGSPTDGWRRTGNTVLETSQNVDNGNPTVSGRVCN